MHVVIVSQYFPPDPGGSATRSYNIAEGLALNGCKVTVIAGFPHYPYGNIPKAYRWMPLKVEQMNGFKVIRTFMPPIKSEGFIKRLLLIVAFTISSLFALPFLGKVDAVWASSWVPGYHFSKFKRTILALNVDDLTLEDMVDLKVLPKNSPIIKAAERIFRTFYTKAKVITPISPGYIEVISKKYCVNPDKIKLVRGGVDLSIFKPSKPQNNTSRKKFTVLYSGAFSVAYDFDQIFEAAKLIEKIDQDVEFVIQGSGELLKSMLSTVNRLKLKNVRIIDSILSRAEVADLLSDSNVLILPLFPFYQKSGRRYAGISSKLYEYQAVGKPIICCCTGVPSDYVKATNSGIAIDSGDSEGLVKAVLKLKQNPQLATTMGENGRKHVEKECSIHVIGTQLESIIQKEIYT